jgi:uncharacterized protein (TIGR03067 family)
MLLQGHMCRTRRSVALTTNTEVFMKLQVSVFAILLASMVADGNSASRQEPGKDQAIKRDVDKLQGEWKLVRCEVDGSNLDIGPAKLVIAQNSYVLHIGPGNPDQGTYLLKPLDKTMGWDARSELSKETVFAIYELNGNLLRVAYRQDNKRPATIFGQQRSDEGHVLYVFERYDGKPERP